MKRFVLVVMIICVAGTAWAADMGPRLILELSDDAASAARSTRSIPTAVQNLELENAQLFPVFHLPNDPTKLEIFYDIGMHRYFRLVADNLNVVHAQAEIELGNEIETTELAETHVAEITPNDYSNYDMWGLTKMQCPQAWNLHYGNSEVIVTTIDTGCTIDHPDLAANIRVNPGEDLNNNGVWDPSDNNNVDDDSNGFIDDLIGYDFVSGSPGSGDIPSEDYGPRDNLIYPDVHGHGTHVMGSAAGVTNNDTGIASASWNVKAMPLRAGYAWEYFGSLYGSGSSEDFAEAVNYAVNNGARVISISFGGSSFNGFYEDAVNYARANNVIIFASAGNNNNTSFVYPAAYTNVIAVAATDDDDEKASFSTYGNWISISAPGVDIWSTMSNNAWHPYDYAAWDGTSMASPNAAAVAGLLLNYDPSLTDDQIENIILTTTDDIDWTNPSYVGQLGTGRVNAYSALAEASVGQQWPRPENFTANLNPDNGQVILDWNAPPVENAFGSGNDQDLIDVSMITSEKDAIADRFRHQARIGKQMAADGTLDDYIAGMNQVGHIDELDEFLNYEVYRDDVLIASPTATIYVDQLPGFGEYEYYVIAIYTDGESLPTPSQSVSYMDFNSFVLVEDFNAGMPVDWTIETTIASATWHIDFGGERTLFPSPYMLVDSDADGNGPHLQERLITPYLDLTDRTLISLVYNHVFDEYQDELGRVQYSINNGGWHTIVTYDGPDIGPEQVTHDMTAQLSGQPNVRFSWYYDDNDNWGWWWGVDDVFVYAQQADPMTLTISPINSIIGPSGGNVTFSANLVNHGAATFSGLTYWIMATLPNGNPYGPTYTQMFTLNPNQTINVAQFTQYVPAMAPSGTYSLIHNIGFMPDVFTTDEFTFIKTGAAGHGNMDESDWSVSGSWPQESIAASQVELPTEFSVGKAYPNPFNPSTSLSVNLPQAAELNVTVYNIAGQLVATLASGTVNAGSHTFTFDASNMSSGLYFIRAMVPGQLDQIQKVTLMK
jgi:subtilisin family serine protease